jgi:hypothetical protein
VERTELRVAGRSQVGNDYGVETFRRRCSWTKEGCSLKKED